MCINNTIKIYLTIQNNQIKHYLTGVLRKCLLKFRTPPRLKNKIKTLNTRS